MEWQGIRLMRLSNALMILELASVDEVEDELG